ncbi:DUF485 domain-containing protein [Streptomyces violarus]|uniref:Uncharacterized membrane protein (DUF485 family) n=1 Tax=Streptomyces violarus TaxID=67380 RepID=A0A7W4ZKF6_9ACTN|nr:MULTISPECIES: DUF485 domain-containing protein [Streptomyces]MBB3074125.1 uncharacterized membrane protein (DUF485 family) [Streptomyces violarus]WRT96850.1 DUF485 domain-containing protein [Streptomyces sp. CGMCC 4.1772]
MTYADENRYPPSAQPYGSPPRHETYGQNPWPEPYGHDTPGYDSYGRQAPWDAPYAPYAHETHRDDADLAALRSAYRLLRRISTLAALGSFVVYVVLSCYAPGLMGSKVTGELSLGMALGILQLVVTFAAVFWYGRGAQRSVDPLARAVRERAVPAGRNAGMAR